MSITECESEERGGGGRVAPRGAAMREEVALTRGRGEGAEGEGGKERRMKATVPRPSSKRLNRRCGASAAPPAANGALCTCQPAQQAATPFPTRCGDRGPAGPLGPA